MVVEVEEEVEGAVQPVHVHVLLVVLGTVHQL